MNLFFWRKPIARRRVICLCHDIERGLGHVVEDSAFSALADQSAPAALMRMLANEKEAGVKATYNVVGSILPEVRAQIAAEGHCIAFHSYDHGKDLNQLQRCRLIDSNIQGYRPAQSVLTPELSTANLKSLHFSWLASSGSSLGITIPEMQDGIVKIPIAFDDYALYRQGIPYEDWEKNALQRIQKNSFIAFSLHDCYASFWLPYYRGFLNKIRKMGTMKTLQEIADELEG